MVVKQKNNKMKRECITLKCRFPQRRPQQVLGLSLPSATVGWSAQLLGALSSGSGRLGVLVPLLPNCANNSAAVGQPESCTQYLSRAITPKGSALA